MPLVSTARSRVLAHVTPPILKIDASSAIELVRLEDFSPLRAPPLDALAKILCFLICPSSVLPVQQSVQAEIIG